MGFRIIKLDAPLGADVIGFPFASFTAEDIARLRAAWLQHLVLRFRDVAIDDAIQVRFSRALGPPVIHPRQLQEGAHGALREILVVSNAKKEDGTPAGDLGDGEVNWHTDTWFKERPPSAAILRAIKLPAAGGNTYFANTCLAYETLPADVKATVSSLQIHHQTVIDGRGQVRLGMQPPENDDFESWPGVNHPIVRRHGETSRPCLYLGGGRKHQSIVGMGRGAEAAALLERLWSHATKPEHVWVQTWSPGDMLMWDNRCTLHRRDAFDPSTIRLMHRTTVEGERPLGFSAAG